MTVEIASAALETISAKQRAWFERYQVARLLIQREQAK